MISLYFWTNLSKEEVNGFLFELWFVLCVDIFGLVFSFDAGSLVLGARNLDACIITQAHGF